MTKSYLHHEMDRGAKEAGVKRIRIHDLRHSHVSLLIEMGFSALAIADRVGHESVDITYKYAHLFPSKQQEMAQKLDMERKEDEDGTSTRPARPLAEQGGSLPNVPGRGRGSGSQSKALRADQTGVYHPPSTDREIIVVGNPRVYKALRDQMTLIYQELQRLAVGEEVPPDLLETLQMVAHDVERT